MDATRLLKIRAVATTASIPVQELELKLGLTRPGWRHVPFTPADQHHALNTVRVDDAGRIFDLHGDGEQPGIHLVPAFNGA
jgi:hypothetical protein